MIEDTCTATSLRLKPMGEKDCAHSWLQCEISRFLAVSTVACESHSIAPGSQVSMSVIKHEKKWDNGISMVNEMKFVVDLNLGYCSLGSKGSNVSRVEGTPGFFSF